MSSLSVKAGDGGTVYSPEPAKEPEFDSEHQETPAFDSLNDFGGLR